MSSLLTHNEWGEFDPIKASKTFGMTARFKGGGAKDPPAYGPPTTGTMGEIKAKLYPMIERGMEGKGYGPGGFNEYGTKSLQNSLMESYVHTKSDLASNMNRFVPQTDTRVREYMDEGLRRGYIGQSDQINRAARSENIADKEMSMGMAADYLAGEKKMAISGTNSYNQALMQSFNMKQDMGTFGTNVAGGIGETAMDFMYAKQMSGKQ